MTAYELLYRSLRILENPLYSRVYRTLKKVCGHSTNILDVGGRSSPQTVGLDGKITISELPRDSEIQQALGLGATPESAAQILRRRSNIVAYVFDDMTRSNLPNNAFDVICAVEVLEHVEEDAKFIESVAKKLALGGHFFMTTPNGDFIPNTNPDHVRHYKKKQLEKLLSKYFTSVQVQYAIYRRPFFWVGGLVERRIGGKAGAFFGGFFYALARLQLRALPEARRPNGTMYLVACCTDAIRID